MKLKWILPIIIILALAIMLISCQRDDTTYVTAFFDTCGGSEVEAQKIEKGEYIYEPVPPTRDGYTFTGWYYENRPWDFSGVIKKNTLLTARWEPIQYSIKYVDGNCSLTSYFPNQEYDLSKHLWTTDKAHMVVESWYFDKELTKPASKLEIGTFGDLTLYAKLKYMPLSYNLSSDNEYTITGCEEGITELVIPATINGNPVKHIASYAFSRNRSLTSVTIERGLTSIGDYAFHDCSALESIKMPDSVEKIGNYAFALCKSLKEIKLPPSTTSLGNGSFSSCSSLKRAELNNGITVVKTRAFSECSSLEYVDLGHNTMEIEDEAFWGCTALSQIVYGSSIESIGSFAFSDCSSLKSIVLTDKITKIMRGTYSGCTSILELNIGDSITQIDSIAFENCTSLTRVLLGNNVSKIGNSCFKGATSLKDISISYFTNLTIGSSVFENCTSLKNIVLPKNVISIGSYTFKGCDSITINCEASVRPSLWHGTWAQECNSTVNYGYAISQDGREPQDDLPGCEIPEDLPKLEDTE